MTTLAISKSFAFCVLC